jgi:hypothetical protein
MPETKGVQQTFAEFKPSKSLWFWSCAGCVAVTMIVGFTLGGWVTGGTAKEMAADAADDARAELVASACIERFSESTDFAKKLVTLKGTNSWERSDMLEEGGWVTLAGMKEPLDDAAEICANKLAAMETPVASAAPGGATLVK